MEGVGTPVEGETVDKRSCHHAHEHTQQRHHHAPGAYQAHALFQPAAVGALISLGDGLHTARGHTHVGRVAHQLEGGVEEGDKAHAPRAEDYRHELVAYHRHQDIESLDGAKHAGVFEDMLVGCMFHISVGSSHARPISPRALGLAVRGAKGAG